MVDPISDMLTRIRNAQAVGHSSVDIPFSKLKFELAKLLAKEELIGSVDSFGRKPNKMIKVELSYLEDGQPLIRSLKRISRPGQRIYLKKKDLKPVKQGHGINIVSTSQGLMTDKQARYKNIGGEVLCQIW